ncbi:MAG: hypothetical protein LAT51_00995 [Flavobacteriaceae bacterium]|nr:hypothetical protein [Flavobacteriaceae bacterium]
MKINKLILSLVIVVQAFVQKNDQPSALELVEQVAEKTKIQEGAVENFYITANVKTTTQILDVDFEIVKHALLNQQELDELNTEIKRMLKQAGKNYHIKEENYAYQIEKNKFEVEDYSHENVVGVNYEQELIKIFKNSLEGELFNKYSFLGIRSYKAYDLKHGIWSRKNRRELGYFLHDYVGNYTCLDYGFSPRLPEYMRKTKRYTYQYEEDASLAQGLVKVSFEATRGKEECKQGYFIIDKETKNLVEVYLEKQHDEILGCSISSTHVFYEKQNEGFYLPTKIALNNCQNCYYYKRKHKLKRVQPEPKESLKFKTKGNYDRKQEMEILIDYRSQEVNDMN